MRHVLLSSLAMPNFKANKEIRILDVRAGDRFLLSSDGLTDVVDDTDLRETILSQDNPQQAAEALVQRAVENDAGDDMTCLVFHVRGDENDLKDEPSRPSLLSRIWRACCGKTT